MRLTSRRIAYLPQLTATPQARMGTSFLWSCLLLLCITATQVDVVRLARQIYEKIITCEGFFVNEPLPVKPKVNTANFTKTKKEDNVFTPFHFIPPKIVPDESLIPPFYNYPDTIISRRKQISRFPQSSTQIPIYFTSSEEPVVIQNHEWISDLEDLYYGNLPNNSSSVLTLGIQFNENGYATSISIQKPESLNQSQLKLAKAFETRLSWFAISPAVKNGKRVPCWMLLPIDPEILAM